MTVYQLAFTDAQTILFTSAPDPYEPAVGTGDDSWSDGNDATYETAAAGSFITAEESSAAGILEPYTGPLTGVVRIELFFRASVETSDGDGSTVIPIVVEQYRHSSAGGGTGIVLRWTLSHPSYAPVEVPIGGGIIYDFSVLVTPEILEDSGWDTLDEAASGFVGPTGFLFDVFTVDGGYPLFERVLIHSAWVEIEVAGVGTPKLRLYPRDDVLGFGGVSRQYPPQRRGRLYGQQP